MFFLLPLATSFLVHPLPPRCPSQASTKRHIFMPTPGSPESAMAAFNDGLAAFEAGSYADALECFDKSLYLHPDASPQALESRLAWKEKSSAHAREQEVSSLASIPSLLPPLPTGERLTIATGSLANCDTGGHLWSSAPALCRWLKSEAEMVAGKTVIELGCGTGAVGIYAAGLAARQVVSATPNPNRVEHFKLERRTERSGPQGATRRGHCIL